jgi:putative ABC transport system permease protein
VNSVLASVLDRMREIGVLRAIGATRSQIARSIVIESGMIGLAGGVLAAITGTIFGYFDLDVIFHHMWGVTVFYRYPAGAILFGCLSGLLFAAVAGYLPARSATRLKPTEALQYE